MLGDIGIGVLILAVLGLAAFVVTHHKPPATPAGADLANVVGNAASASWEALKRDLPGIISAENAQLKADLAAALQRERAAVQALAEAKANHNTDLAQVAGRVVAAITGSPELPPSPVVPAVAAAQAADAAQVVAYAKEISPAPTAL